jgi:FMN phosphatase YigB (HAD superfamily)
MIVIPGNRIVYCDVDSTILDWDSTQEDKEKNGVLFTCPGSMVYDPEDGSEIGFAGEWSELLVPNWPQIEQLKKHRLRHHTVVVWSSGGYDWAETAVRTLKLEQYVDVVISKPVWLYDDLQPSEFMPKARLITKDKNENS